MVVKVIARQWSWRFEYANGFQTDKLIVPVDTPVEVQIVSEDVIHSFFVPAFRIKQDAVPGLTTRAWFSANVAGSYDILPHSSDGSALVGPTFKGLFGGPARIVQDGKTRTIVVDESYLRRHILDHDGEIVEGYPDVMPAFRGKITDQELDQIVQFIKSLR
jgi:cytochrome c oxidase subunit 2